MSIRYGNETAPLPLHANENPTPRGRTGGRRAAHNPHNPRNAWSVDAGQEDSEDCEVVTPRRSWSGQRRCDGLDRSAGSGLEVRAEPGASWCVVRVAGDRRPASAGAKERGVALLAAEDAEVAWRIDAMRPQVPQRGAIPVLVARERASGAGCLCLLRGAAARRVPFRCSLCARAAWVVLHEIREDVRPER